MYNIGIICEYNPFHNGHLFHLNQIKKKFPNSTIVLVMTGNFTQRGDISIINKWEKTEIALSYGVDLVVELPFVFTVQGADVFARASIEILTLLQVEYLIFGSESNQISNLIELSKIQLYHEKYNELVKTYLKKGTNYPTAVSNALFELSRKKIKEPNDILGIAYIREILKTNCLIKPICIPRKNNYNSKMLEGTLSSATSIRYALKNNIDIRPYVPNIVLNYINEFHFISDYFSLLKYKILSEQNHLNRYYMVDEGLENRIQKFIISSNNLDDFILNVKSKRYTYNKLNRMFIHILCGITKEEMKQFHHIEYIRVLGFSKNGRNLLKNIKNQIKIPIITNFSSLKHPMLDIEFRVTCIYASIFCEKKQAELIESEYKKSPIMH